MPEVSVIIPNYNHADYLEQRVNSVLNQTYNDIEIVILDDCSTDESKCIIESYKNNSKVSKILLNECNSGSTFKQWEKGIGLAKGKYIWIAESDDYCENTFLETIMNGLIANSNCVAGYAQSYVIDESNNILWQSNYPKLSDVVNGKNFIKAHMLYGNGIFNASMAVFKKDVYNKISKDFSSFKFCGDWLFWIEIMMRGDIFVSGKLLNYFRKHPNDVSGKVYETGYNFFEEIKLLDSLKTKSVITSNEYENLLWYKYNIYKKNKYKILKSRQADIDNLFTTKKGFVKNSTIRKLKKVFSIS